MFFLPLATLALAFLPGAGVPDLAHPGMPDFAASTDLSVSRYGNSPSYDLSVSHVGYTPSYALSIAHVGYSPSYAISIARAGSTSSLALLSAHNDSTSLLEPRMCVLDRAEWNESFECAVSVAPFPLLFWLLSLCMLVSIASLHCLIAGFLTYVAFAYGRLCAPYFLNLCASLFRGLCTCLISGVHAFVSVGLCFFIALCCFALLIVGSLGFLFASGTLVAFQLIVFLLFNCFCGCLFVGHLWYNIYLKFGRRACSALGICLGVYFGMGMPLFVGLCAFYYYGICTILDKHTVDRALFSNIISGVSFWVGDHAEDFVHLTWRPLFDFSSGAFFCLFSVASSLVFFGPNATFFFYGVRPFITHSTFF